MTTMTYGQLVEAYVAVREERDRLRAELDRLRRRLGDVLDLEELPEDHTIVAAVRRLRAERSATPDNAEARIEWGVRSVQHGTAAHHILRYDSEAKADDMLDYRRHRAPAGCTDPHATKVRRTITTWGDGGMHITPWQTVEETP